VDSRPDGSPQLAVCLDNLAISSEAGQAISQVALIVNANRSRTVTCGNVEMRK
jgi:hypothetical protein